MANRTRRHKHTDKRGEVKQGWLHPTKGWRAIRRDPRPGYDKYIQLLVRGRVYESESTD